MSLGCLAPRCLLSVCGGGGGGGGGGGEAGCGLGRGCIFFGELRVSAVWICLSPLPPRPLFFREGSVHRGGSVTDVCLCYASIYLFGKQMHY